MLQQQLDLLHDWQKCRIQLDVATIESVDLCTVYYILLTMSIEGFEMCYRSVKMSLYGGSDIDHQGTEASASTARHAGG